VLETLKDTESDGTDYVLYVNKVSAKLREAPAGLAETGDDVLKALCISCTNGMAGTALKRATLQADGSMLFDSGDEYTVTRWNKSAILNGSAVTLTTAGKILGSSIPVVESKRVLNSIKIPYIPISSLVDLAKIGVDANYPLSGCYKLTANINASATATYNITSGSAWNVGTTYALGDNATDGNGNRYASIQAGNIGHQLDDTAWWRPQNYKGWNPIGDATTKFTGVFDGNGYTISNLSINRPTTGTVGLFGYTIGATIKNLGVTNVSVIGQISVGGLVGRNESSSTISNCYSTGSVTGNIYVGGLVGYNNTSSSISNSYSTGRVIGNERVGGLVGFNNSSSTITNCYSTGRVTGSSNVGGLVGQSATSTITSSYYDTETSLQIDTGKGILKTTAQMKQQATFTDWNFAKIWQIIETITYPYFRI